MRLCLARVMQCQLRLSDTVTYRETVIYARTEHQDVACRGRRKQLLYAVTARTFIRHSCAVPEKATAPEKLIVSGKATVSEKVQGGQGAYLQLDWFWPA